MVVMIIVMVSMLGDSKQGETGGSGRRASSVRLLCCKYLLVVCLLRETAR